MLNQLTPSVARFIIYFDFGIRHRNISKGCVLCVCTIVHVSTRNNVQFYFRCIYV